ncbi:MAG: hypothetical protein ACTSU5_12745, partial [Promethearchaeota archaeon]
SSCYGVKLSVVLDILEQINLLEVGSKLGVTDYLKNFQSITGGFYEENDEFLVNDTYQATNEITGEVCDALSSAGYLSHINATGLTEYVYDQMGSISEVESLNASNRVNFYREIKERYYLHDSFLIIDSAHLRVKLIVNDETTYPNQVVPLSVEVSLPEDDSYLVEGCDVYVTQFGSLNDFTLKLEDNQNGLYEVDLVGYAESDRYVLRVSVDHPSSEYFSFVTNYTLVINDPIDAARLAKARVQSTWFNNVHQLRIPVINQTDNNHTSGCNVTLWSSTGELLRNLVEHNDTSDYQCALNFTPWWLSHGQFVVKIEGNLVRTQELAVDVYVIPPFFFALMVVFASIAAGGIALLARRRRYLDLAQQYIQGVPLDLENQKSVQEKLKKAKEKATSVTARAVERAEKVLELAKSKVMAEKAKLEEIERDIHELESEMAVLYQGKMNAQSEAEELERVVLENTNRESVSKGAVSFHEASLARAEHRLEEARTELGDVEQLWADAKRRYKEAKDRMHSEIQASIQLDPESEEAKQAILRIENLTQETEAAALARELRRRELLDARKGLSDIEGEILREREELEKKKAEFEIDRRKAEEARETLNSALRRVSEVQADFERVQKKWELAKNRRTKVARSLESARRKLKSAEQGLRHLRTHESEKMKSWIEVALEKRQKKERKARERQQSPKYLEKQRKKSEKEILLVQKVEAWMRKRENRAAEKNRRVLERVEVKEKKNAEKSIAKMQNLLEIRKRAREEQRRREKKKALRAARKRNAREFKAELQKQERELDREIEERKRAAKERVAYILMDEKERREKAELAEEKKRLSLLEGEKAKREKIKADYKRKLQTVQERGGEKIESLKREWKEKIEKLQTVEKEKRAGGEAK